METSSVQARTPAECTSDRLNQQRQPQIAAFLTKIGACVSSQSCTAYRASLLASIWRTNAGTRQSQRQRRRGLNNNDPFSQNRLSNACNKYPSLNSRACTAQSKLAITTDKCLQRPKFQRQYWECVVHQLVQQQRFWINVKVLSRNLFSTAQGQLPPLQIIFHSLCGRCRLCNVTLSRTFSTCCAQQFIRASQAHHLHPFSLAQNFALTRNTFHTWDSQQWKRPFQFFLNTQKSAFRDVSTDVTTKIVVSVRKFRIRRDRSSSVNMPTVRWYSSQNSTEESWPKRTIAAAILHTRHPSRETRSSDGYRSSVFRLFDATVLYYSSTY